MGGTLTSAEVLAVLRAIDRREVTLTADRPPADIYAGDCAYRASNGWTLVVFIDCGDWDYLDHATAPDGREWDFDDGPDLPYRAPSDDEEVWRLWGIPYCAPPQNGHRWTGTLPPNKDD